MTKQMMVLVVLFVYVLIRSVFIEPNALEVTRYQVVDRQLNGIRVAFLSDFHLKKRDYKRLDKIVILLGVRIVYISSFLFCSNFTC